jgi:hypothetical protein
MTGPTGREKPIPDTAHGKEIGEYLRALRREAGAPTYRELAAIAKVEHHTLSQTANGQRICGAAAVKQYVDAVRQYGDRHGIDLAAAMRPYAPRFQVDPDTDVLDQALAVRARLEARRRSRTTRPAEAPVREPPAPDPPTVPSSLAKANALDELVDSMLEMIEAKGWDVRSPRRTNHVAVPEYLLGVEAQRVLTGRRWLTATVYARILEACGAGYMHGDTFVPYRQDWAAAWHRVAPADLLFVEPPADQGHHPAGQVPAIAVPGPTGRDPILPRSWLLWRRPWQGFRNRQRRADPQIPPRRSGPADGDQPAGPDDSRN